jgi:hypothetical protein
MDESNRMPMNGLYALGLYSLEPVVTSGLEIKIRETLITI